MNMRILLVGLLAMVALAACEKQGPAERLGEQVDEMAEDAANAAEDACEDAKREAGAEDTDC